MISQFLENEKKVAGLDLILYRRNCFEISLFNFRS